MKSVQKAHYHFSTQHNWYTNRHLVFKVPLCRRFNLGTFQLITGISKFFVTVTRWVDKTQQEAGS